MPGCARSPKRSGFDTILERLVAGVAIDAAAMADLSVGGLLREIQTRPQPRGGPPRGSEAELAVLVLAAGRSSRMGDLNKLTQPIDDAPMVARVAEGALAAEVGRVTVVVGHAAHEVEAALDGRPVALVHNPDFAEGLSTSLRAGINAVADASAAIVCLADMPRVRPETLRALAAAHAAAGGGSVCVPVFQGKRGNPVLWDASWFPELRTLAGDVGARGLLAEAGDALHEVDVDDPGVLIDVDTRDALARLRRPSAGATAPDDGNV